MNESSTTPPTPGTGGMSDYSKGLRHGREDLAEFIAEILGRDISDEEKIKQIRWLTVPLTVTELPDGEARS